MRAQLKEIDRRTVGQKGPLKAGSASSSVSDLTVDIDESTGVF